MTTTARKLHSSRGRALNLNREPFQRLRLQNGESSSADGNQLIPLQLSQHACDRFPRCRRHRSNLFVRQRHHAPPLCCMLRSLFPAPVQQQIRHTSRRSCRQRQPPNFIESSFVFQSHAARRAHAGVRVAIQKVQQR